MLKMPVDEEDEEDVTVETDLLLPKGAADERPEPPSLLSYASKELYGDALRAHAKEVPRLVWLSVILYCIIGSFWLLDSLKDTVFATMVGLEYQPVAKLISVFTTLVLVLYYNSLLDRVATTTVTAGLGIPSIYVSPSLKLGLFDCPSQK